MRGAYSMLTDFPVAGMEKMSRLVAVPIIIYPCVCMWRYTPLECYIYIYNYYSHVHYTLLYTKYNVIPQ